MNWIQLILNRGQLHVFENSVMNLWLKAGNLTISGLRKILLPVVKIRLCLINNTEYTVQDMSFQVVLSISNVRYRFIWKCDLHLLCMSFHLHNTACVPCGCNWILSMANVFQARSSWHFLSLNSEQWTHLLFECAHVYCRFCATCSSYADIKWFLCQGSTVEICIFRKWC